MARSLKKGPFIHYKLEKKVLANVEANKKTVIKTWSRASMISPDFVGQTIAVHNGKTFIPVSAAYAQRPRTWHRKSSRRSSGDGHDDRLAMRRHRAGAKVRIWKNTKLS